MRTNGRFVHRNNSFGGTISRNFKRRRNNSHFKIADGVFFRKRVTLTLYKIGVRPPKNGTAVVGKFIEIVPKAAEPPALCQTNELYPI